LANTESLWHFGLTAHAYYYLDRETAEMTGTIEKIEPHSILTVRSSVWDRPEHRSSPYIGPVKYTSPFLYVPAFLSNYGAELSYFPVNYKEKTNHLVDQADYVLVWRMKEHQGVPDDPMEGYDRIHSGKTYSLYRRRRDNPADELWQDNEQVHFDF